MPFRGKNIQGRRTKKPQVLENVKNEDKVGQRSDRLYPNTW